MAEVLTKKLPAEIEEAWIETYTGSKFHLLNPDPEEIDIEDIAQALSQMCRFGGHTKHFYSVAEHSVHISNLAEDEKQGLLHEASEAYVADIVSPLKHYLTNYKEIEDRIMRAAADKLEFRYPISLDTKDADIAQLKTEARHLLISKGKTWVAGWPSKRRSGIVPKCWSPEEAKMRFLERFEELS